MTRTRREHIAGFLHGVSAVTVLSCAVAVFAAIPALAQTADFANTTPLRIPPATPCCGVEAASVYPSTINVSGVEGLATEETVTLHGLSHENIEDLAVLLVAPGGGLGSVLMASYERGHGFSVSNQTPTFGEGGEAVECAYREGLLPSFPGERQYGPFNCGLAAPFPSPAPREPYEPGLRAEEKNGTWSLYVANDLGDQGGNIGRGWSLHIQTIGPFAPTNLALPSISGVGQIGQTLQCSTGAWDNGFSSTESFGYRWLRDGLAIASATGSTYVVQSADQGHTLACEVTASNTAGSRAATSVGVAIPVGPPLEGPPLEGSTGGGGVLSSRTAVVTSAQIAALLAPQLTPFSKAARIVALLKDGGLAMRFKALEAGTAVIDWYEVPPGAKLAKNAKPKPVLMGAGRRTFPAAGTATIKIKLTAAGKGLLKHAKKLKLTAKGTFTPTAEPAITATRAFILKR